MAKKKKTLPKDFGDLIDLKDIAALKSVFDTCELDARGGYGKTTALSFYRIPNELVRWLVAQGADLEAVDTYNRTALHQHCSIRGGDISVFLELGANVHALDTYGDTPLHFAAGSGFNLTAIKLLMEHGADVKALDNSKQTPLERALSRASNIDLPNLVGVLKLLLEVDGTITQKMKDTVTRKGEDFEFHRENFNKDYLKETDEALNHLYEIFDVVPVKRRIMHDGVSPILVSGKIWQEQYEQLWELLVPSKGSAKTVQGEAVRIAGKVRDEIYRNGGGNWDANFKKMLDSLLVYYSSGNALSADELANAEEIVKYIRKNGDGEVDELNFLCELATKWVLANPNPVLLEKPNYNR
ncbi:ankyrin repeat domain-containing protein [Pedobacter sp. SL55]|uniref:ankyrin repeat domain-containing protein n=1 Tax=Pedobacter sp. SL55 TaxID=2995161 RepID=UPI00226F3330|nr:ankyrin repeat domain-containing protein [Pedobacter sp. SL55]WAC39440.1 ankyrin repeat domain-containing protein [Pedobacter sp. SL55]